jgi:hypothetical protein
MNTISTYNWACALCLFGTGLVSLALGCKDDSPCDEGQEYLLAGCVPVAAAGSGGGGTGGTGSAGTQGGETDGGIGTDTGTAAPAGVQAEVGDPCQDTTASSDCGGNAPICAPLPSGTACTQILCLDGEPNAGACPADWTCLQARPMPDPSVCLKF